MKESSTIDAAPFTLEDLLDMSRIEGDIEIINECNETLLILSYIEDYVCSIAKLLSEELLRRRILSHGVRDGRLLVKIEGVEDAD